MDDQGTTQKIGGYDVSSLITNLTSLQGSLATATDPTAQATVASTYVKGSGTGTAAVGLQVDIANLNSVASQAGSDANFISNQQTYNSAKMDALNTGLGALVDADLAKESANLTALQIKQQLGQQSLSISNQAPSGLVSLFR